MTFLSAYNVMRPNKAIPLDRQLVASFVVQGRSHGKYDVFAILRKKINIDHYLISLAFRTRRLFNVNGRMKMGASIAFQTGKFSHDLKILIIFTDITS